MHFGIPTLLELRGLEENMKFCKTLDLDFVELNMNVPEYQPDALRRASLNNLKDIYNLDLTMHLPENFYFADFNKHMRHAAYEIFKDAADLAAESQMDVMNMHMHLGTFFTTPDKRIYLQGAYLEQYLENVRAFKALVDQTLKGTGTSLCIENACDFHHDFIKEAVGVLLESEHIHLTWDTGHNVKGKFKDQVLIFDKMDEVKHVHLHDCAFGLDHQPLGTGDVCVKTVMSKLTESCRSVVIESKTVDAVQRSLIHMDVLWKSAII